MKSIVTVNIEIPGVAEFYDFQSGRSLSDYDIILFDPDLPYYARHSFSDGSSALARVSGQEAITHILHWRQEILGALRDGKTVFFLLREKKSDSYVTGVASATAKNTTYNTANFCNHDSVPFKFDVKNSKGERFAVRDNRFHPLFETLKKYITYEAMLTDETKSPVVTTPRGTAALGAIYSTKDGGHFVILPCFDLSDLAEFDDDEGEEVWTKEALGVGTKVIKNLKDIDKFLNAQSAKTPPPDWVENMAKSDLVVKLQVSVVELEEKIRELSIEKESVLASIADANLPQDLLFETGTPLENSIEALLRSIGYTVSNFREGALEIDHLITSPEGKRFIGEAEGKDTAAINITKFRQLESNIGEDFERDEVAEPAGGILFGNGFRYKLPTERPEQFTDKCLTNAKRLNTILVRTSDLYPIAVYLQDHPTDEEFKADCRRALESAPGSIAQIPPVPETDAS